MIPPTVALVHLDDEFPGAVAWASRNGWSLTLDRERLLVTAVMRHPIGDKDDPDLQLDGDFTGYQALPPAWQFVRPAVAERPKSAWPKAGAMPGGKASIFHAQPVICAPFNRLAFKQNQGPHDDWGGPSAWLQVDANVKATTLGDMLAVIAYHLSFSAGRLE
jgi:hypothetical protein